MRVCGMRTGIAFTVDACDRARLEAIVADRNRPQKHVWRARIILLTSAGVGTSGIERETGKDKTCVWRWQERFMLEGIDGLLRDKTRPSRKPPLATSVIERVVTLTKSDPPSEATHWTAAAMAKAVGVSISSVQRIWRAHGLQPKPRASVQAVQRSRLHHQAARHRWPLRRSAGARHRAVGRREVADSGPRPNPARFADQE